MHHLLMHRVYSVITVCKLCHENAHKLGIPVRITEKGFYEYDVPGLQTGLYTRWPKRQGEQSIQCVLLPNGRVPHLWDQSDSRPS